MYLCQFFQCPVQEVRAMFVCADPEAYTRPARGFVLELTRLIAVPSAGG